MTYSYETLFFDDRIIFIYPPQKTWNPIITKAFLSRLSLLTIAAGLTLFGKIWPKLATGQAVTLKQE